MPESRSTYGEMADRAASVERTKEIAEEQKAAAGKAGRRQASMETSVQAAFESDQAHIIVEWAELQLAKGLAKLQTSNETRDADVQRGKNDVYMRIMAAAAGDDKEVEIWARSILARRTQRP